MMTETGHSPRRRWPAGLAAAALVAALAVGATTTEWFVRPASAVAAEAGAIDLPPATSARPEPTPIRIRVAPAEEGQVELRLDGERVADLDTLRNKLYVAAGAVEPPAVSERDAILEADRKVRWREMQWVMQTCAHPDVRLWRLYFAVDGPDGPGVLPAFLPRDRGLGGAQERPTTLTLKRTAKETSTRVVLADRPIGVDEIGFAALGRRLAEEAKIRPGMPILINAWADVPYEDVVRAVDRCRRAGLPEIRFTGAPDKPR